MISSFDNLQSRCAPQHPGASPIDSGSNRSAQFRPLARQGATFSKIFRWQPASRGGPAPGSVEVTGSFSDWQVVPLVRDTITDAWQLKLDGIPGNRTHRYMLLVDGVPANDINSDGLAVPEGLAEQQYQLVTARGPRVFLLFAQTK